METLQCRGECHGLTSSAKTHKSDYQIICVHTSPTKFSGEKSDTKSPENYRWWRKVSASKSKPSTNVKIKKSPLRKAEHFAKNGGVLGGERERIKEKIAIFRGKCKELSRVSCKERGFHRIDFKAMEELKRRGILSKKVNVVMGSIPGVEIGDTFKYRVELMIVGLHSRSQHGIDYAVIKGNLVATCIVATEGYPDKMSGNDILTYIGEGGMYGEKEGEMPKDQKMERGNLALKISARVGNDVRVVRGVRYGTRYGDSRPGMSSITYVYDGLYKVVECRTIRGLGSCKLMFEFKLRRNPNQPVVPWHKFKAC